MGTHLRVDPQLPAAFLRLRSAAWASNLGDGVRNSALPLLAASIDGSAVTVASVAAAGTVPFALFGTVAGTVADRSRRVPLVVVAHLFRAVVMGLLIAAVVSDRVSSTLLVGIAFLLGCGESIADSAAPALVPSLVEDHRLEEANGALETAELVANDLVGPPLGGALTAAATAAPFLVDAVSFVAAATLTGTIHVEETHVDEQRTGGWWRDLVDGIRHSWLNPVLRHTATLIVLLQVGNAAVVAPIVVYLTDRLGLGSTAYGLFLGLGSLGGIAGARIAPGMVRRFDPFPVLAGSVLVVAAAFTLMSFPRLPLVGAGFVLVFAGTFVGRIVVVAARQRSVLPEMLGRAQGTVRSLLWGAATVGALIGGFLADHVGQGAPFLFAAALSIVALVGTWVPLRATFDDMTPRRRSDDPNREFQRQRGVWSRSGIQSDKR